MNAVTTFGDHSMPGVSVRVAGSVHGPKPSFCSIVNGTCKVVYSFMCYQEYLPVSVQLSYDVDVGKATSGLIWTISAESTLVT